MSEGIVQILMRRDSMSQAEAEELKAEAKEALQEYINSGDLFLAEDICAEYFGLEPDYLMELL